MRLFFLVLVICVGALFYVDRTAPETFSCIKPIHYSIGVFDERFDLNREDFLAILLDAEKLWEEESGKELFKETENGPFKINLIYDERQEKTELVEATEEELNEKQDGYKDADMTYRDLADRYERGVGDFETELASYNAAAQKHVADVNRWNASSSKTLAERDRLQEEERRLSEIFDRLESEKAELESLYAELSVALEIRNELVKDYNREVNYFNEEFAGSESFDQGNYSKGEINIYQFKDENDLRLVLAHEFGHALGIGHVDDPQAVMHYLLSEQQKSPIVLTEADREAFANRCFSF